MAVPDWSGLVTDALEEIANKLSLFEDFTAFRGVCTSWRAAANKDKFVSKVPLLMLPEKSGDGDVREFYSLRRRKIVTRMPVPEARGKKCLGAGFGWHLTVASSGGEMNLVKLMSSSKIQLPNMMTFPGYDDNSTDPECMFVYNVVLSANPSETSDFVLMMVVNMGLGFWRNGDKCWTKKELRTPNGRYITFGNMCCYKNKVYMNDFSANIWVWDPLHPTAPEIFLTLHASWRNYLELPYMVESSKGELLLINRCSVHGRTPEEYENCAVVGVIQIDTEKRTYGYVTDLGQDAIFIGLNNAVSVAAGDFPGVVKPNCIYFTDTDFEQWERTDGGGKDMGIYNVGDKSIERFDVESSSLICPPFWMF